MNPSHPLHINTQYFQSQLPNAPMFVPQLNITPQLHPMVPMITGMVMLRLQGSAQQNVYRTFLFNLLSTNGYQNQEFVQLMQFIMDMIQFNIAVRRMDQNLAIQQSVEDGVSWTMAARVLQNHQVMGAYLDAHTVADFQQMVGNAKAVMEQVQNFKHQMQNQPVQPMSTMPYTPAPMPGMVPGQMGALGNMMAAQMDQAVDRNGIPSRPGTYGNTNPAPMVPTYAAPAPQPVSAVPTPGAMDNGAMGRWGSAPVQETVMSDRPKPVITWGADPAPSAEVTPVAITPSTVTEPVIDIARPLDRIELDDAVIVPAYQHPDLERSWSIEYPHGMAYNPITHMLSYSIRRETGEVIQILTPWTDEMDYLQHELDEQLQLKERKRREVMTGRPGKYSFHAVELMQPDPEHFVSLAPEKVDTSVNYNLDNVKVYVSADGCYNLVANRLTGVHKVRNWLKDNERPSLARVETEMYFDIPTIIYAPVEIADAIPEMGNLTSFAELHDTMQGAAAVLDESDLFALDGICTRMVMAAMQDGMGMPISIDSFLGDWTELAAKLQTEYVDGGLYEALEAAAPQYIRTHLNVLDEDVANQYLEALEDRRAGDEAALEADHQTELSEMESAYGQLPDVVSETDALAAELTGELESDESVQQYRALVFVDRVSITSLPVRQEELDVVLTNGALVAKSALPDLHAGLAAILKRTGDEHQRFTSRYLLTQDGKLSRIVTSLLVPDAILLSPGTRD